MPSFFFFIILKEPGNMSMQNVPSTEKFYAFYFFVLLGEGYIWCQSAK